MSIEKLRNTNLRIQTLEKELNELKETRNKLVSQMNKSSEQEVEIEQSLRDILTKNAAKISSESTSIFISPNIPMKKLNGALSSYGQQINEDEVIVLFDDTVFGGAKEGFIITEKIFASKEMLGKPNFFFIKDIKDINIVKQCIYINGNKHMSLTQADDKKFISLFKILKLFINIGSSGNGSMIFDNENHYDLSINNLEKNDSNIQDLGLIKKAFKSQYLVFQNVQNEICNRNGLDAEASKIIISLFYNHLKIVENYSQNIFRANVDSFNITSASAIMISMLYAYSVSTLPSRGEDWKTINSILIVILDTYLEDLNNQFNNIGYDRFEDEKELIFLTAVGFVKSKGENHDLINLPKKEALISLLGNINVPEKIAYTLLNESKKITATWIKTVAAYGLKNR